MLDSAGQHRTGGTSRRPRPPSTQVRARAGRPGPSGRVDTGVTPRPHRRARAPAGHRAEAGASAGSYRQGFRRPRGAVAARWSTTRAQVTGD